MGRIRKSGWEPNRNINIREDKGGELGRVDGNLIGTLILGKIRGGRIRKSGLEQE